MSQNLPDTFTRLGIGTSATSYINTSEGIDFKTGGSQPFVQLRNDYSIFYNPFYSKFKASSSPTSQYPKGVFPIYGDDMLCISLENEFYVQLGNKNKFLTDTEFTSKTLFSGDSEFNKNVIVNGNSATSSVFNLFPPPKYTKPLFNYQLGYAVFRFVQSME